MIKIKIWRSILLFNNVNLCENVYSKISSYLMHTFIQQHDPYVQIFIPRSDLISAYPHSTTWHLVNPSNLWSTSYEYSTLWCILSFNKIHYGALWRLSFRCSNRMDNFKMVILLKDLRTVVRNYPKQTFVEQNQYFRQNQTSVCQHVHLWRFFPLWSALIWCILTLRNMRPCEDSHSMIRCYLLHKATLISILLFGFPLWKLISCIPVNNVIVQFRFHSYLLRNESLYSTTRFICSDFHYDIWYHVSLWTTRFFCSGFRSMWESNLMHTCFPRKKSLCKYFSSEIIQCINVYNHVSLSSISIKSPDLN